MCEVRFPIRPTTLISASLHTLKLAIFKKQLLFDPFAMFLFSTHPYAFIMISIILNFLIAFSSCGLFAGRIIISPFFTR